MKKNKVIVVIGAFGSGKSEYSINLARELKKNNEKVSLVDLDVINPYFRSREVKEKFLKENIEVIAPEGEYAHADLPMISPRIRGAINDSSKLTILDVGGDPSGCRAVKRFLTDLKRQGYETHFVVNTKRPFTNSFESISEMIDELEFSSGLKIHKMICNTNLMEETDSQIIENGIKIIQSVADGRDLIFEKYLVMERYSEKIEKNIKGKKRVIISHFLKKPWENKVINNGI